MDTPIPGTGKSARLTADSTPPARMPGEEGRSVGAVTICYRNMTAASWTGGPEHSVR